VIYAAGVIVSSAVISVMSKGVSKETSGPMVELKIEHATPDKMSVIKRMKDLFDIDFY